MRGVAQEKGATVAEVLGDAVMDAVGGEPVDVLDVNVDPVEDAMGDVVPGDVGSLSFGLLGLIVANGAYEADATVVVEGEDGEEVGVVEGDVELAIGDRAARLDVGDVEEVRVLAAREADVERLTDDGAGAVAASEEGAAAGLLGAVSEAEEGGDGGAGVSGRFGEGEEFGGAFDRDAECGEMPDEERFVFVLWVDEDEGEWAEAAAEVAEKSVRDLAAGDPEVGGGDTMASVDELVSEAELLVELERAGLHGEGARVSSGIGILVNDADADAEAREPEREYEAGGAGAGDEDLGVGGRQRVHA